MFKFSTLTEVNKTFRLTELTKQMTASKEAKKEALVIESVALKNVISPTTLRCEPDKSIKEIYIFEIKVKEMLVPEKFIAELDNVIKLHTLFNVRYGDLEYSMISFKSGANKGKYWSTNWESNNDYAVPLVNTVPEMYNFILSKFLKYSAFENEHPNDYVKRYNQLIKLDFQISKTQAAIAHESQSKKKFEYNARLKTYIEERNMLLGGYNG